jgi:hypothetical protein
VTLVQLETTIQNICRLVIQTKKLSSELVETLGSTENEFSSLPPSQRTQIRSILFWKDTVGLFESLESIQTNAHVTIDGMIDMYEKSLKGDPVACRRAQDATLRYLQDARALLSNGEVDDIAECAVCGLLLELNEIPSTVLGVFKIVTSVSASLSEPQKKRAAEIRDRLNSARSRGHDIANTRVSVGWDALFRSTADLMRSGKMVTLEMGVVCIFDRIAGALGGEGGP